DAIKYGEKEKILYTICICPEPLKNKRPDYFAVIDVDPESPTYSQRMLRNSRAKRSRIVIPALNSDRIYILNAEEQKKPYIEKELGPKARRPNSDTIFGTNLNHDVLVASEWGAPKSFRKGLNIDDAADPDLYGQSLNVYSWSKQTLEQVIDLGKEGGVPLEIRFLHDPKADQGFVGCALQGKVFRFFRQPDGTWDAEKAIDVPVKTVEGWFGPEFPDIRQYDITDPKSPKLVGQIFLGGKLLKDTNLKLLEDPENQGLHDPVYVKGRRLHAAPQMFQLSLDGKRMYVSTSLFSPWDEAIYPETMV
ncbi:hypothetical protein U1Q18_052033, partial [Sarracenia purpurea var. burkii]